MTHKMMYGTSSIESIDWSWHSLTCTMQFQAPSILMSHSGKIQRCKMHIPSLTFAHFCLSLHWTLYWWYFVTCNHSTVSGQLMSSFRWSDISCNKEKGEKMHVTCLCLVDCYISWLNTRTQGHIRVNLTHILYSTNLSLSLFLFPSFFPSLSSVSGNESERTEQNRTTE